VTGTKSAHLNGFTLIEVLVALVVTALLLTILFNGLIGAHSRSQHQAEARRAQGLALRLIQERRHITTSPETIAGRNPDLTWRIQEDEIARDPRGGIMLINITAIAGPKRNPRLITLKRRYLRIVS
jgi:prepilin-type N-terminal cleavage/methylation domain-containing protein